MSLDENPVPDTETVDPTWTEDGVSVIDGLPPTDVVWLVWVVVEEMEAVVEVDVVELVWLAVVEVLAVLVVEATVVEDVETELVMLELVVLTAVVELRVVVAALLLSVVVVDEILPVCEVVTWAAVEAEDRDVKLSSVIAMITKILRFLSIKHTGRNNGFQKRTTSCSYHIKVTTSDTHYSTE